jgi:hypothetical protein
MSTFQEREASQNVVVDVPECRVVSGETARFPFGVRGGERSYSLHEFSIGSDNPNFDPRWAHIVKATDGMGSSRYILEIRPAHISRRQYGTHPISIRCTAPDAFQTAVGRCTLIVKPCVRLIGKPDFSTWPGGSLSLSLENCGGVDIDVSVSVSHHGSSWSKGWEFELETEDGPFEFKETFEPPADGRRGQFELEVSAEGVSLIRMPLEPEKFFSKVLKRKYVLPAAVALIGAAVGITLTTVLSGPALISQSISYTSQPTSTAVGATYVVTAKGGGSGNPVAFTIDAQSASTCTIAGGIVTFNRPGSCVIDANQAGTGTYAAAPQVQQVITVGGGPKTAQSIVITSKPPSTAVGTTYPVTAKGGGSGNPVIFTIDAQTASTCSIAGAMVTFNRPGSCVIDANQAGTGRYAAAPQVQQVITVTGGPKIAQSIVITAKPPSLALGTIYTVTATGGGSGNPVTFSSGSPDVCSVSGATVSFNQPGSCVIDANQAGTGQYAPAPQVQQVVAVKEGQTISFTSTPPREGFQGGPSYNVAATATSGDPVSFSSGSQDVCSVSGATVTFNQPGTCVVDANQAGDNQYLPAPQAEQDIPVASSQIP